jgi:hypothetical protein
MEKLSYLINLVKGFELGDGRKNVPVLVGLGLHRLIERGKFRAPKTWKNPTNETK